MNLKKIMSGAAAFIMTASLMTSYPTGCFKGLVAPVTSEAARELPSGYDEYVTWKFTDLSTVVISPIENCENPIITKLLIDAIDDAATSNNYIENYEVIIEDGINSIEWDAFHNISMTKLNIPTSIDKICKETFVYCEFFEEVVIPDSISIEKNAFYSCRQFNKVTFRCTEQSETNIDNIKSVLGSKTYSYIHSGMLDSNCICSVCGEEAHTTANGKCDNCGLTVGSCGPNATYTLDSQGNLVISGSGDINDSAFKGNESIKNVIIGDEITYIGAYAFDNCTGIDNIKIGENVTGIGSYAINRCNSLTSIVFPNSVYSVPTYFIANCKNLTSITAPCKLKTALSSYNDITTYTHPVLNEKCICTNCGESLHTYTTDPHKCDKCEDTSVHTDADKNSNCDICGKDIVRIKVAPADEKIYAFGDSVTITAPTAETGMTFDCWLNSQNVAVSNESQYTFTATVNDTFTPKYKSAKAETMTVVWVSAYGQEMGRKEIDSSQFNIETLKTEVSVPSRLGYEDGVWILQTDSVSEFTNGAVMTFVPEYKKSEEKFAITSKIDGVTETKSYLQTEIARVTAPETNSNGQKFSCWKDENGTILSYSTTYGFYVAKSLTLTAVYNEAVEEKGTANIVSATYNSSTQKMTFVSQLTVPDGAKMLFAGLVATMDETIENNLTTLNAKSVKGGSDLNYKSYRYTWNLSKSSGITVIVRSYLKYSYNGKIYEIYGSPCKLKGE